jgi:hypothetical protein
MATLHGHCTAVAFRGLPLYVTMRIFHIARRPPQWLRVVLASALLVFAINSVAHAAHRHDARTTAAHIATCGYHATFDSASDAPQYSSAIEPVAAPSISPPVCDNGRVASPPQTHAQPRAPPAI